MHPAGLLGAEPRRQGDLHRGCGGSELGRAAPTSPANASLTALGVVEDLGIFQARETPQDLGYSRTNSTPGATH